MTAPLKPIESPDGLAGAAHCSAKITQRQLESILINEGIIQAAAIEDPDGYDGGKTELAIRIATQQINELTSPNDELVEHCRRMRTSLETISTYYRGDERSTESALEMRRIAKRALWPNAAMSEAAGQNRLD